MRLASAQKNKVMSLVLLSIVLPVGLLATFRLTGILKEAPEVQRVILEPVTLTLSRPSARIDVMNKSVQNVWADGRSSVLVVVEVQSYREGSSVPPYYGYDGVRFKTSVNASLTQSDLVNTVRISFHPSDENSMVFVSEERWNLRLNNATLTALQYVGWNSSDAYINAQVLNSACSISDEIYWIFLDEHDETHELHITAEIVHSDGTTIGIIAIPIELRMTSD